MGHVTWPRPFQGRFVIRRLGLAMFNPHIKFEMSTITCKKEIKGNDKRKKNSSFEPHFATLCTVHLSLTGKRLLDFLWVLIKFFSLAHMSAALFSEICQNRRFLKG